jgi:DNA-binding MarR family transcriptional regulator
MDLAARFLTDRADLSASAGFAINRVCREGPLRLTALAAKEGISQPSMTQLIQRLERQGLVTRLADPDDGRAALIGITGHGQELIDDRTRLRRDRLKELLASLTSEEECALWLSARVALPILDRMIANADGPPMGTATHPAGARRSPHDGVGSSDDDGVQAVATVVNRHVDQRKVFG